MWCMCACVYDVRLWVGGVPSDCSQRDCNHLLIGKFRGGVVAVNVCRLFWQINKWSFPYLLQRFVQLRHYLAGISLGLGSQLRRGLGGRGGVLLSVTPHALTVTKRFALESGFPPPFSEGPLKKKSKKTQSVRGVAPLGGCPPLKISLQESKLLNAWKKMLRSCET